MRPVHPAQFSPTLSCTLTLTLFIFLGLPSFLPAQEYRIDHVVWRIEADSRPVWSPAALRQYHELYVRTEQQVFERFGLAPPLRSTVVVARGAWIFTRLTSLPEQAAGVWLPARNIMVLQDLDVLARRGVLSSVLEHELTHAALSVMRTRQGLSAVPRSLYLDEMFCQLEVPQMPAAAGLDLLRRCATHDRFAAAVEQLLRQNPAAAEGSGVLRGWGAFIRRQRGGAFLLEAAVRGEYDAGVFSSLYAAYRAGALSAGD